MSTWYYVDGAQTRHGPVDAAILSEAYRLGRLTDDSLVWREGLDQWGPMRQFRDELGLGAAPVFAAPAYVAPAAEAPKGKGCMAPAIIIGVGVVALMVLAILAAIAIPAYQDYVGRAKLAQVILEAESYKVRVEDFVLNTDRCPRDAAELQIEAPANPAIRDISVGEANTGMCMIELELGTLPGAPELAGERIRFSRDSAGDWYCTSEISNRTVLPATCR